MSALVDARLVSAAAACDGNVTLQDSSRSNPVFVLSVDDDAHYVVKQPTRHDGSCVEAEAVAYRWLASEPDLSAIAPRVVALPGRLHREWIVLEVVSGVRPMHELVTGFDADLHAIVVELARTLRRLHSVSAVTHRAVSVLPAHDPWLFDLVAGRSPEFATGNPAAAAAVTDLQADDDLLSLVRAVGEAWQRRAAIHGDVKWDNVLVRSEPDGPRVWLIDWELAAWGDPLWDLAGVVEGLLTTFVLATGTLDASAVAPLARAAVGAYRLDSAAAEQLMRFVAARLAQVTVQLAGMAIEEEGSAVGRHGLLELARSLAKDRARWAALLCAGGAGG